MATKAEKEAAAAAADESKVTYSKADKKNIKALKEAGVELTGEETGAELDALIAEHDLGSDEAEPEEIEGVENSLPQKFEETMVDNKPRKYGIYFVAPITKGPHKGKHVLYNEKGVRVSPVMSADRVFGRDPEDPRGHDIKTKEAGEVSEFAHIAKAAGAANSLRRARRLPNDKE